MNKLAFHFKFTSPNQGFHKVKFYICYGKTKCLGFVYLFVMQKNTIHYSCTLICLVEHTLVAVDTLCMPIVGKGNTFLILVKKSLFKGSKLNFYIKEIPF